MVAKTSYVAPPYVPLDADVDPVPPEDAAPLQPDISYNMGSGLLEFVLVLMIYRAVRYFLLCDLDLSEAKKSCIGFCCPSYLFGRNAEFLGSGTLGGSCMTHFILCTLVNALCCLLTEGVSFGLAGCCIAPYACGYRRTIRRPPAETSALISSAIYAPYVKNTEKSAEGVETQTHLARIQHK
ncbi:UNVERIFIED_CONTAM: protein PLANT CADMIUM RESISTANCE 10 [Sesamum radiatum]|uniref:Protein PLANT CADMIUM RESISTANCE 10 n=1 Tax=Sesamum radiatum TaxID=300843 RepID=A0AAW2NQI7_SESRA